MIQTFSAQPVDIGFPASLSMPTGQADTVSFVALFAQALVGQEAATRVTGSPALAALFGQKTDLVSSAGAKDVATDLTDGADLTSDGAAVEPSVLLQALLGSAMVHVPGAREVPAEMVEPDGVTVALDMAPDPEGNGKKLPFAKALVADHSPVGVVLPGRGVDIPADVASIEPAEFEVDVPQIATETSPTAASGLFVEEAMIPAAVANTVSTVPISGQENTLLAVRHAAPSAGGDKVVLVMQNGLAGQPWQQELGDKLVWVAGRQGQSAELILNPPSLGSVEVRLNLTGSEASAQFFSANPGVRDAIESALPRLREMMSGVGISLGEAMVSDQSFGQRDKAAFGKAGGSGDAESTLMESADLESQGGGGRTTLLDYFA